MAKGDRLTDKQKSFCEHFASNGGNSANAARSAGYSESFCTKRAGEILKTPIVSDYIDELTSKLDVVKIAKIEEIQSFWTDVVRGKVEDDGFPAKLSDRLKASEILARSQGAFVEKLQVSGANGEALPSIVLNFVKPDKAD